MMPSRLRPLSPDPISIALQPPANETQEQRAEREAKEQEAFRVSNAIDEILKVRRL
jgi:guanine nucleotide-binding protein subunit alpha